MSSSRPMLELRAALPCPRRLKLGERRSRVTRLAARPGVASGRVTRRMPMRTACLVRMKSLPAPRLDTPTRRFTGKETVMVERFSLNVNGQQHEVEADPDMPLLYAL